VGCPLGMGGEEEEEEERGGDISAVPIAAE
jgi:hypothetical protein